ncbi:MAG: flagellar basal body rod protein FlgC [Roseicyclus sp.]|jgi:flagellar basal-body rod protein FlgC|nr:flagellar basal body rod protein FlgC [Roseicyclus sp.]
MTMSIDNVFDVAGRAMSAQMVRLNTVATNLANMNSVSGSEDGAFRALRPVFRTEYESAVGATGLASVNVEEVVSLERTPERVHMPDHPSADAQGYVYRAAVNREEEMVEMLDASRQYQTTLEAVSTLRTLMARTMSMGR